MVIAHAQAFSWNLWKCSVWTYGKLLLHDTLHFTGFFCCLCLSTMNYWNFFLFFFLFLKSQKGFVMLLLFERKMRLFYAGFEIQMVKVKFNWYEMTLFFWWFWSIKEKALVIFSSVSFATIETFKVLIGCQNLPRWPSCHNEAIKAFFDESLRFATGFPPSIQ